MRRARRFAKLVEGAPPWDGQRWIWSDVTDVARIVLASLWHGIFTARQGGVSHVAKSERFRVIQVSATDGGIGNVVDFLLDDEPWIGRYLVVQTGDPLFRKGRTVLLSPISFRQADGSARCFSNGGLVGHTEEKKMTLLTHEWLTELLTARLAPCLSVYQPTHRRHPENKQDPIRFRNLVKELEVSLHQRYPEVDARPLLEPFEALARNEEFWNHTLEGLAVLGGTGIFRAVRLPQRVPELVVAGDSFHTKPLRRFLQSVDRYQVLGLSLHNIRFFEGTRHALDEIELVPGVPRTITEALGTELTEPRQIVVSHGGHGQGGKADETEIDAERFFRAIDRAVLEHYSRPSGLPLILTALAEHHDLFHQVSQNPFLVAKGISIDPTSISAERLQVLAWQGVEPQYQARLAALGEEFKQARSQGLGSSDLAQVATAAAAGRVATLLIEADRQIIGLLHATTGQVELAEPRDSRADELLDDLGELTANMGGQVFVIPAKMMPVQTGLAATYRH